MDKNILKYIKTETLDEGRVKTTVNLLLLDAEILERIIRSYVAGEVTNIEMRVGSTIKHPKDKYDRTIALKECSQRLRKRQYEIIAIESKQISGESTLTTVYLEPQSQIKKITLQGGKVRIYA